jgi:IS1 family transposase
LYRLKTPSQKARHGADHALTDGLDPSAAQRVFGSRQATITSWLARAGDHAQTLHERFFCHLYLPHVQLDELRNRLRCTTQVHWLAIDPLTKILPVLELGPRTQHMAHRVIHSLRQLLAPGCIPLFTSDGLNLYFYTLTAHFGQWLQLGRLGRQGRRWQVETHLIYCQVKKCYRRRKLVRVMHVMRLGTQADLSVALQGMGFSGRLNTAFIERVNLTIRHGIAALARRTWATAQQSPQLLANLEWWRAYHHGCRVLTSRCAWPLQSLANEVASVWHNAIGTRLLPWQLAEPPEDGPHVRCSRTPAARFRLRGIEAGYGHCLTSRAVV